MKSVFQKFGGIRPMAAAINVPASTVKSWHVKGQIPGWRHSEILLAARSLGIALEPGELVDVRPDEAVPGGKSRSDRRFVVAA